MYNFFLIKIIKKKKKKIKIRKADIFKRDF